ncbi:class I SAM-dependent methyltransferase [Methylobacterium oryzihabitans]|uniref:Class I SAM-dependent methyltransferase n=1 Tax=Methylobacterium oryzihabitans TaxID=2499852 RepID=A0A3S2VQ00_9HYPH|nr:class I SAM-dependent methyltransferase [Methylobacterium oryzihabitans]RVU18026.1 class I SAM-dependent methyltransferase [Methylobacterium oryzihabitans]
MSAGPDSAVYGRPPPELADPPEGAVQLSPLIPGSEALEAIAPGTLSDLAVLAPPGTVERRFTLALALRALAADGALTVLAPKEKGGSRLARELAGFGCAVEETAKRHHRVCRTRRPARPDGLDAALAEGAPRRLDDLGLWSQPGVFSWNRIDPGTALLLENLPALAGRGADLGCGIGVLAKAVLAAPKVTALALVDIDRRAVEAARRNVEDPRASFAWADLREAGAVPERLDFVVMNPPFHDGGAEDRALGQGFVRRAAASLRPGGTLWLTANAHLPYEAVLDESFRQVTPRASERGYKVFEAKK